MMESSEFMVTLFSGFAQAESESVSKNVSWGIHKSMENGNVPIQYSKLLGYKKGADGLPEIARWIFKSYLKGYSYAKIKEALETKEIKSPRGGNQWSIATICGILRFVAGRPRQRAQKFELEDLQKELEEISQQQDSVLEKLLADLENRKLTDQLQQLTERKAELSQQLDSLQRESEAASTPNPRAETVKAWTESHPAALTEYDELLTRNMVQRVTVVNEHLVRIRFYGVGEELEQEMDSGCK